MTTRASPRDPDMRGGWPSCCNGGLTYADTLAGRFHAIADLQQPISTSTDIDKHRPPGTDPDTKTGAPEPMSWRTGDGPGQARGAAMTGRRIVGRLIRKRDRHAATQSTCPRRSSSPGTSTTWKDPRSLRGRPRNCSRRARTPQTGKANGYARMARSGPATISPRSGGSSTTSTSQSTIACSAGCTPSSDKAPCRRPAPTSTSGALQAYAQRDRRPGGTGAHRDARGRATAHGTPVRPARPTGRRRSGRAPGHVQGAAAHRRAPVRRP